VRSRSAEGLHTEPHHRRADELLNTAEGADQCAPSHTIFGIDHLVRNRTWLEHDDASFSERIRPYVAECKEKLERDFAKVVAQWDNAL
jgi:hypothetical protein